jgi:peptidoglycan/xylan/chitin deacetylase (PgdA/CDA1 family)
MRPLVLAYHGVGDVPRRLDPHGLTVPADQLRREVRRLRARGYEFVKQAEFARRLHAGETLDSVCSLTFDDGTEDYHSTLPALLEELDVPATFFVCPALLGQPYPFLDPEAGVRFMTRDELLEVAADPRVEIGSHTRTHVKLGGATGEEAYSELAASKRDLEDILGRAVPSFAFPNCEYSPEAPAAAERAGHTSAVTCAGRGGLTPYELSRESPSPVDGRIVFELRARGWFHGLRDAPPMRLARRALRPIRHRHSAPADGG